jgi:hypothetical protein
MYWIHGILETSDELFGIWQRNLKGGEFLDQFGNSQEKHCFIQFLTATWDWAEMQYCYRC